MKNIYIGSILLLVICVFVFIMPIFSPYGANDTDILNSLAHPSREHPLGCDSAGRDILTRLMYGGQISLAVGFFVMCTEMILGLIFGTVAGYFRRLDRAVMMISDVVICLPALSIIILVGTYGADLNLAPSVRLGVMCVCIALLGWPSNARQIRSCVMALRERDELFLCGVLGFSFGRKLVYHIFPHIFPTLAVSALVSASAAMLLEASLSFLGMGVMPPYPSWGNLLTAVTDRNLLLYHPNTWAGAAVLIFLTVLSLNIISEGIREMWAYDDT